MVGFPFTRIWLANDGAKDPKVTGVVADYDLLHRRLDWYRIDRIEAERVEGKLLGRVLKFMPLASPLLIVPVLGLLGGYTLKVSTPAQRLGQFGDWVPVLLGLLIALALGMVATRRPGYCTPCEPPVLADQVTFLEEVYEFSLRHNNAVGEYKTPYLVNILATGTFILAIPVMFWVYHQPDTLGSFLAKLVVLGMLISVVPLGIWALVVKGIIVKRQIKMLSRAIGAEGNG